MTFNSLGPVSSRLLDPFVTLLARAGLTPNAVSFLSLLMAAVSGGLFFVAEGSSVLYPAGAFFVFATGWFDIADGELARRQGTESRAGDLLDHGLDRYGDVLIVGGLAGGIGRYDLGLLAVTGMLLTSYIGSMAQAIDLDRLYGGLLGRSDRLILISITTVVTPFVTGEVAGLSLIGILLVFFGVGGHFTAFQRTYDALKRLDS
jgi:archaetidylinositol phosphate synthase